MPTTIESVHAFAMTLPGTVESVACAGTAIESRTAVTGGRAFLFAGAGVLRFKSVASIPELAALAAAEPDRYQIGSAGWIKVTVRDGRFPPIAALRRWIRESHGLCAKPAEKVKAAATTKPAGKAKAATKTRAAGGARPSATHRRSAGR